MMVKGKQKEKDYISIAITGKDDMHLFIVYMSINLPSYQDRMYIEISDKQNFMNLLQKIRDNIENRFNDFKGLKGLRVLRMRAKSVNKNSSTQNNYAN